MPPDARSKTMTLRLTDEEVYLREQLATLNGIDGSGVMRMALRKLAKQEGIAPYVPPAKASVPKGSGRRPREE